jgi:type II secretory pathway pseudopilin PulG
MGSPTDRRGLRDARGYVLLVFALFSALLVIGLYRILPKYVFEGQRIKEEELIFRGEQYKRAIQLFVRKFGRYPATLEELENTNQIRFIRQLYPDPMTEEGEWRLVHIGPNAVFYDSVHLADDASDSSGSEERDSGRGDSNPFDLSGGGSGEDESDDPNDIATRISNNPGTAQQSRPVGEAQAGQQRFTGTGIAGVASMNEGEAIKVVGGFTHYNEWEFLYDYRADPLGQAAMNRVSGGGQQEQRQPPNASGQQNPLSGPSGRNPFTGLPIGMRPPGGGFPGSVPGSPVPIPGGPRPSGGFAPAWTMPQQPSPGPSSRQ